MPSVRVSGGVYIGEKCRIGGEIDSSVILSYTNKYHFSYIGHSYVGSWVNIGAGAVTSDLKNTYGIVRMTVRGEKISTGMIKVGAFIGDHVKISIGSMLYTGRKVGTAAHIGGHILQDVPPFTFYANTLGMEVTELKVEKIIEIYRKMCNRRDVKPEKSEEDVLRELFIRTREERETMDVKHGLIGFRKSLKT